MLQAYPFAFLTAVLLSVHGYRKGSLSHSGAVAAFVVGYITLANPVKAFGLTLLSFYLIGSRATKIGHEFKANLERDFEASNGDGKILVRRSSLGSESKHKAKSGGQRTWVQVFCNGLLGAATSAAFRSLYADDWQSGRAWCLLKSSRPTSATFLGFHLSQQKSLLPRVLFLMMLGHFACCMGDTLASETGILAKKHPRLILPPFRQVPPGTNGALSWQGTLGSVIGGALMGFIASLSLLYLDNPACHYQALGKPLIQITVLGALAGAVGSAIDSLLGATLQQTCYSRKTKQVLLGRLPPHADRKEWQIITGRNVLDNNTVNLLSSTLTAVLTAFVGARFIH